MPTSQKSSKKASWANREGAKGTNLDSGPYVGIVMNAIDPARAGRLQVYIPDFGNSQDDPTSWVTVSYASPFFGHTQQPVQANATAENNNASQVEHTYGMWMVVPDAGSSVLCTFVAGDRDRGYWFACVNSKLSHTMWPTVGRPPSGGSVLPPVAPDIANAVDSTSNLPITEFNDQVSSSWTGSWASAQNPVHEHQASYYLLQGLDRDLVRGAISSSSQREVPSAVFGISTPGRATNDTALNYSDYQTQLDNGTYVPPTSVATRTGGHSLVMDDGDAAGTDQLIRLRTASGHQILMNDTEGLIYIANSTGTSWIEMDAVGHIQMYARSGFSVRSEGDINLHADQNLNLQGQTVNINALTTLTASSLDTTVSARTQLNLLSAASILSGTSSAVVTSAATNISSTGVLTMNGSTINLNCGGVVSPVTPTTPTLNTMSSTQFDSGQSRWNINAGTLETIVSTAPCHEPYNRNPALAKLGQSVNAAIVQAPGASNALSTLAVVSATVATTPAGS